MESHWYFKACALQSVAAQILKGDHLRETDAAPRTE